MTMEAQLINLKGEEVGKVQLKEDLFASKPCPEFLHEFVTVYEANQRRGTANTKTRSEVSGGGKKPWKQKHTGRARAGSTRSPLWRHGGVSFGPRSGRVRLEIPRQKARRALAQALAARFADGRIVFVDSLSIGEPKTKAVAAILRQIKCEGRGTLLVLDRPDATLALAGRNIPGLEIRLAADLNAYAVLQSRRIVMTQPALEKLSARWN